jgi:hypothetical protein
MTIDIRIDLEPGEVSLPEARAVQLLQNALAIAANITPDELVQLWRTSLEDALRAVRPKHGHGRKKR